MLTEQAAIVPTDSRRLSSYGFGWTHEEHPAQAVDDRSILMMLQTLLEDRFKLKLRHEATLDVFVIEGVERPTEH